MVKLKFGDLNAYCHRSVCNRLNNWVIYNYDYIILNLPKITKINNLTKVFGIILQNNRACYCYHQQCKL